MIIFVKPGAKINVLQYHQEMLSIHERIAIIMSVFVSIHLHISKNMASKLCAQFSIHIKLLTVTVVRSSDDNAKHYVLLVLLTNFTPLPSSRQTSSNKYISQPPWSHYAFFSSQHLPRCVHLSGDKLAGSCKHPSLCIVLGRHI